MRKFETQLSYIQSNMLTCQYAYAPDLNISEPDLRFLKAKGLIRLKPAGDNEFYVILTDQGITYFDDKIDERNTAIRHWSINFATAILSATFGSALTLLIQAALLP